MTRSTKQDIELPSMMVIKPFGRVSIRYLPDGHKAIRAWLSLKHVREQTQTGIAIEGSVRMAMQFGRRGILGCTQRHPPVQRNLVALVTQKMGSYLARRCDADRHTTVVYWGTGTGEGVELVGDLSAFQVEQHDFAGPQTFSRRVCLLPAVQYFVDRFVDSPWGMYYFLTTGHVDDLAAVDEYSKDLASKICSGQRNPIKFILVGIGERIARTVLRRLDTLKTGTPLDLWDYWIVKDVPDLFKMYPEMIDSHRVVGTQGVVRNSAGTIVADYRKSGVPSLLRFELSEDASRFSVDMGRLAVTQRIP